MIKLIKRPSIGGCITVLGLILLVVSLIVYGANVSGAGYFHTLGISSVVTYSVVGIVFLVLAIAISAFDFGDGLLGKGLRFLADALRIVAAVFIAIALVEFINGRVEGLAYIYFSDENILATIQTADNLSSAHSAIAGFIMYGVTAVVLVIGAFFSLKGKSAE